LKDMFGNNIEPWDFYVYPSRSGSSTFQHLGLVVAEGVFLGSRYFSGFRWFINSQTHRQYTEDRSVRVYAGQIPLELQNDLINAAEKLGYRKP
jgi:hypothetical protein